MSNLTELPDLDRDWLALALLMKFWKGYEWAGVTREEAARIDAAFETLARRAQPEGEAPQAVVQVHLDNDNWMDVASSELPTWERKGFKTRTLYTASAAQHAESGAQAGLLDELAVAMREHCSQHDNYLSNLLRRAFAALAAQSQGAQAAQLCIGFANNDQGVHVNVMQRHADGATIVLHQGRVPAGDSFSRFALAAKAEAPALTPLDYRAQGREEALAIILAQSAEDPFSDCIGWGKSGAPEDEGDSYWDEDKLRALLHIGDRTHDAYDRAEGAYWEALGRKDEAAREMLFVQQAPFYKPLHDFLSKHEAWDLMGDLKRAQQAAAPGALDPNVFFDALSDFKDSRMTADDAQEFFDKLAAPSAPGTPEAPTLAHGHRDDFYLLANGRRLGMEPISRVRDMPNWVLAKELFATGSTSAHQICRDAGIDPDGFKVQRAAQLDGGQGEGEKA